MPLCDKKLEESYIVIGAHYDVVDGSSGMNDNLSSVAILVLLICQIVQSKVRPSVEIVFFDGEENGRIGSNAYVSKNRDLVNFMINLDVCGVGDKIVYTKSRQSEYDKELDQVMKKQGALVLEALPEGDDWSFNEAGIPNVSIAMLPEIDAVRLSGERSLRKILHNRELRQKLFSELQVIETTHGGSQDNMEVICFTGMCRILNCIKAFIREEYNRH